jgi:hypothetical protein
VTFSSCGWESGRPGGGRGNLCLITTRRRAEPLAAPLVAPLPATSTKKIQNRPHHPFENWAPPPPEREWHQDRFLVGEGGRVGLCVFSVENRSKPSGGTPWGGRGAKVWDLRISLHPPPPIKKSPAEMSEFMSPPPFAKPTLVAGDFVTVNFSRVGHHHHRGG